MAARQATRAFAHLNVASFHIQIVFNSMRDASVRRGACHSKPGETKMAALASTVTKYLGDLTAVLRHCCTAIERQTTSGCVSEDSGMADGLRRTHAVLHLQLGALENRLSELEGRASLKEALTTVTGFLAGLYDKLRSEALSRMLRDDFAALHFAYACQTMMIATAEACGDRVTAQLVSRHQRELPDLIRRISDLIPA